MKRLLVIAVFIFIMFTAFMQSGCRYDKQLDIPCVIADSVHFKSFVLPILIQNCSFSGCHAGNNPPNGVFLDTYQHVKDQLLLVNNTPKLLGVIRHDPGFDPMPQGRPPLDLCTITKIEKWIAEGAKQN
jgi:hypothetical protein